MSLLGTKRKLVQHTSMAVLADVLPKQQRGQIYFGTDANGKNKVNFSVGKIMNPWW